VLDGVGKEVLEDVLEAITVAVGAKPIVEPSRASSASIRFQQRFARPSTASGSVSPTTLPCLASVSVDSTIVSIRSSASSITYSGGGTYSGRHAGPDLIAFGH